MIINRIGINYTHNNKFEINRPSGSGDYLFLLIKTPSMIILDGEVKTVEKDSIILFSKGTPQHYHAQDNTYTNDFIHFDIDNERDIRTLPLNTVLKLPSTKPVNKILKDLYIEYISNNANKEESMTLLLKYLFVKVSELIAYLPNDNVIYGHYDALLELRSNIYRHPEKKWSVDELSRQANLSPSYFQRLYKQTFGITCMADVISCKIEYAKNSLASTSCTVREISAMCGYDNYEHFMRQFKQSTGMTPSKYRSLIK